MANWLIWCTFLSSGSFLLVGYLLSESVPSSLHPGPPISRSLASSFGLGPGGSRPCWWYPWYQTSTYFIPFSKWLRISVLPTLAKHLQTTFGVRPGDHFKAFTWLPPGCTRPLRFTHLEVTLPSRPPIVPNGYKNSIPFPHISSQTVPDIPYHPCTTV